VGTASDPGFLVLHGLRLKGVGEPASIAAAVGVEPDVVAARLPAMAEAGLAVHHTGRLEGWSLTPAGRAEQARLAATGLDSVDGAPAVVEDAYHRFRALNGELLEVATAWQVRADGSMNDHVDAGHDATVLDRLRAVLAAVRPVLDDLTGALDRYRPYAGRLDRALAAVEAGDTAMVTKPVVDSVHTIWFELHEDLLSTLGRTRHAEAAEVEGVR
jgi:hypothetical protein